MSYGQNAKLAIGFQSAEGTGVTAVGSFQPVPLLSENVGLERPELLSQNLWGRFEEAASQDGTRTVNGSIEAEVTARAVGMFIAAICAPASMVSSGSMKTYQYVPRSTDYSNTRANIPVTFMKQWADASSGEHFYDLVANELEFSIRAGEFMKMRLGLVGGKRTATGIGSMSLPTDVNRSFGWNVASISYNGAGWANVTDLTVTHNEGLAPSWTLNGTLDPYNVIHSGPRTVRISGTVKFDDRALLNDFVNGAERAFFMQLRQTNATAIQSGFYNELRIDIPAMKVTDFKPSIQGPNEVEVSFNARGVYNESTGYTIRYTVVNTYSGAYY